MGAIYDIRLRPSCPGERRKTRILREVRNKTRKGKERAKTKQVKREMTDGVGWRGRLRRSVERAGRGKGVERMS